LRRSGQRRLAADAFTHAADLLTGMRLPSWTEQAALQARSAVPQPHRNEGLTAAEHRVVEAAMDGLSNAEIAARLYVTVATVEAHLTRAYRKLGVRSRAGLVGRLRPPH